MGAAVVEGSKMSFKSFFNESEAIDEATAFNAGDAMEGIFAIGVALYIADGKIDIQKLNNIRKQVVIKSNQAFQQMVDSNIAADGWIANKLPHIQPGNKLGVMVVVNLKNTAKQAFGPKSKPIPNIEETIAQMTNQIAHTNAVRRIEQFIVKVLTDRKPDDIIFYVVADGSQTSASKNQIKGDVMLRVEAKTKTLVPQDIEKPISFSIKTDNSKAAGLSVFTAVLRLGNFFGLPLTKGLESLSSFPDVGGSRSAAIRELLDTKFKSQSSDPTHLMYYVKTYLRMTDEAASRPDDDEEATIRRNQASEKSMQYLRTVVHKAMDAVEKQIQNKDETQNFTNRTFNFIEKEIFGSDDAEVIKLLPGSISEISKNDIERLRKQVIVEVAIVGSDMLFIGVDKQTGKRIELFKLHPDIRIAPSQKVMRVDIVLGDAFHNPVQIPAKNTGF